MAAWIEDPKIDTRWYEERPLVPAHLQWLWSAFEILSTCRAYTMAGAAPIPWTAAHEWARHRGMGPDEEADFWAILSAMDAEWLRPKLGE